MYSPAAPRPTTPRGSTMSPGVAHQVQSALSLPPGVNSHHSSQSSSGGATRGQHLFGGPSDNSSSLSFHNGGGAHQQNAGGGGGGTRFSTANPGGLHGAPGTVEQQ